jgi:hypothetical protein
MGLILKGIVRAAMAERRSKGRSGDKPSMLIHMMLCMFLIKIQFLIHEYANWGFFVAKIVGIVH